mmetsp:Transcript_11054/g.16816  ORF Transcript_11054/g.16816 Transcript_11054/m.16816 type:complete len:189 (+) Transcript_11054:199-765(+)|eukprot:CAMPEP_0196174400 /NCGR_PEP_ID=MMETSP0911-20130528/7401_1 /TAXON_ID=49265 /ORGANISM="Thalassiosira rotula, Strain GSO102" /LENGTH=188 /DNA_ID=CAMNT_0041441771 /DNA_START=555 /DNA_END=1121 /DNA_ORIENTATION=+
MTLKGLLHRLVAQLHIALVLIAYNAAASKDATHQNPKKVEKRRKLNSHFNMKIFWKPGYRWQGRSGEKKWCMVCKTSRCLKGSGIKIDKCDRDDSRQHFYFDDGRIRSRRNTSVCLERRGRSIVLDNCDRSINQVWDTLRKDQPFQLKIPGNSAKCASQHHHPKQGEKVYMTSCKRSVRADSDKWITY